MAQWLVDTCVWSLALRRDAPAHAPAVRRLFDALTDEQDWVLTTGVVLQELLQGARGPKSTGLILEYFDALSMIDPRRSDYIDAANIYNTCRRAGVQLGTMDALIAQLCISRDLMLLTTDNDFLHAAKHVPLQLWQPPDMPNSDSETAQL